mmetsp:Transcript_17366/g.26759  ORF Transcript_17366/g.26759 Transcript_17366/m.26759 type:complete len:132 (+) Transcript_17366:760-1155(+)
MTALNHKEGEVWLVDFWATWCPPCQGPMGHNQAMWNTYGKMWKDMNVKIICISIDNSVDKLVDHVNKNQWYKGLEHYQIMNQQVMSQFQVKGVPHVMLVDKKGKIVFKGHPMMRKDLEGDINTLIEGKALS